MLEYLLKPKAIAVIGASEDREKLGNIIFRNLLTFRFRGQIYPVNKKSSTIEGKKAFQDVNDIPKIIDCAIIVVPADAVAGALHSCGKKKVKTAVIISAGFGERGAEGKEKEKKILAIAHKYRIRILGPNCLGLIVPHLRLNASFAEGMPEAGSVAVISQSGAMAVAITDWALESRIGFSALVSLGNKSDIHEEELLSYFAKDSRTKSIIMYLESLTTGRSLLRTIKRVSSKKPISIILPGKSMEAKIAALSHTGSISGAHDVHAESLRAAGAIVAESLEELFACAIMFEKPKKLLGPNIAIITNAGGPGILATDAVVLNGLRLAKLGEKTAALLKRNLPEEASTHNPVDVIGDAPALRYEKALRILMRDPKIHAVIALLTHQYVTETEKIARTIVKYQRLFPRKIIVASFIGGEGVEKGREILSKFKIPHYEYPEQAAQILGAIKKCQDWKKTNGSFPNENHPASKKEKVILGKEADRLLKRYCTNLIPSRYFGSFAQAASSADTLSYPLVMKIVSKSFVHKTERSLVRVNIANAKEFLSVLAEWKKLPLHFGTNEGILVQPYLTSGLEVFIGAKRDPLMGPYIIVGLGGIYVESMPKPSVHPLPVSKQQAIRLCSRGPLGKILGSSRGRLLNTKRLVDAILGVSRMMIQEKKVLECDCNPVICTKKDAVVADLRIIVNGS